MSYLGDTGTLLFITEPDDAHLAITNQAVSDTHHSLYQQISEQPHWEKIKWEALAQVCNGSDPIT